LKFREGRLVENSHDSNVEGSLGVVNRNLRRVEITGVSPLKEKEHRRIFLGLCYIKSVFLYKKRWYRGDYPSSLLQQG
jgi:hypothetical protein